MDKLLQSLLILEDVSSEAEEGSGSGTTDKIADFLKNMVKNPVFYIVLGALVLLIIVVYLIRRFAKATPNVAKIVIRKGNIYKIIDENNPKYFLVPFVDRIGAEISLNERTFASDKLFINNGPDALYRVNYALTFKVTDPKEFYPFANEIQEKLIERINESLREYADNGNVFVVIREYREKEPELLSVINKAVEEYKVTVTAFKVNFIEPMGGKK